MLKKYKLSFDIWGLLLFLIIMIPNFIWFSIPAPNDVLRADSITEVADTIASICQVLMIIALCIFVNLLLIIFCELDRVLSWYGECGYHIGIDGSSMFGIYVLCH